ncbi:glycosyltransferase family 2 protein [Rubellimicrobium roseum]|uniref:Glycosyltransferase family 2 protein n=1 Tax=Rubellimicrobium roseum TaxID=687525 RepID=A0A5C4NJ85_9RHOB|nr:glycosyltransferase family 2 protein [Rubellimicrobium roseum]TNC73478.1 glycosyltransferase family 2 protein [Rubellimicrobium roseum]
MSGPTSRDQRPKPVRPTDGDDRVERLARRIERQHHLISRLAAMLEQQAPEGAKPRVVVLPPFAGLSAPPRAQPESRLLIDWGRQPPPAPLSPAPGLDSFGLLPRGGRAVALSLLGLGQAERKAALGEMAARQRTDPGLRPVILTDSPALGPALERGYAVEYLGDETADRHRRIEQIARKWGLSTALVRRAGTGGFAETTIEELLGQATTTAAPPAPDPEPLPRPAPVAIRRREPVAQFQKRSYRPTRPSASPDGGPLLSYCIPVMDRGADLRATLGANLREQAGFGSLVEFIVVFFDRDVETQDWVRHRHRREIAKGRLRVAVSEALDSWHFAKAKNAFRPLVRGRIYSSLDADNFVTSAETQQVIDVHAVHGEHFVFHHFSGTWGDGTSGRISLPASLYREVGYNESLLPRQFDEIDLILSVLRKDPRAALICHSVERNLITLSDRTRAFVSREGLRNPFVHTPPVPRRAPLNPRGAEYVRQDAVLAAMTDFNQALSFLSNSSSTQARDRLVALAYGARQRLADLMTGEALVRTLFEEPEATLALARPDPAEVCLFACVRNDWTFLPKFVEHYRRRGVARIFLVDDRSDPPLAGRLEEPGVHVVVPKAGTFLTAKGLWLEALMKTVLAPGQWALTVDADEFVDTPAGTTGFPTLAARAEAQGRSWIAGLLVDMLPGSAEDLLELDRDPTAFDRVLTRCCHVPRASDADYLAHSSIRWGFGRQAQLSWTIDARFHAFGTFDSLRKIPLLRYRPGLHLNQGFHDLHFSDGTPPLGPHVWDEDPVLAIRHYKLEKLLTAAARDQLAHQVRATGALQYHWRTAANLQRILGEDAQQAERLLGLPTLPYPDGVLRALDLRDGGPAAARA